MRKRRLIALMLGVFMCISSLPSQVFANRQSPVREVSANPTIRHNTSGSGSNTRISPVLDIRFTPPIPSGQEDNSNYVENGGAPHEESHYQVQLKEFPRGATIRAPEDAYMLPKTDIVMERGIPVHEKTERLENGKIYEVRVIPHHEHKYIIPQEGGRAPDEEIRWAPLTTPIANHPFQYILTDFDTRVEGGEDSITVSWEDTGYAQMDYKIGYVQGNFKTGDNIPTSNLEYIEPTDIRENATTYRDPDTGRQRYRYVIDNNISTGQMYSAFVESATKSIGNKDLLANRDTPKIAVATTKIGLNVFNIGKDKIRLEWNVKSLNLSEGPYELANTVIKEYSPGNESGITIATLNGKEGANLGYYEYREPKQASHYQLIFTYINNADYSELTPPPQTAKVLYVPGQLRIKPITPQIPKPIGPTTKVTDDNISNYLVPNDRVLNTLPDDMWKSNHTFHANMTSPTKMNLVWSAYNHKDKEGDKAVDLSMLYDITISDDFNIINSDATPMIEDLSFGGGQNQEDILRNEENQNIVGFRQVLTSYLNSDMKELPLTPNKVYYVKVVAKKKYGDEFEKSTPVIKTILFNGDGEVFTPPTISKPPLKLKEEALGKRSATVTWLESWHEILARDPDKYKGLGEKEEERAINWNAKVYTGNTTGPAISFVKNDVNTEHILKNDRDLKRVKNLIAEQKGKNYYNVNYIDRFISLGKNVKYKYKVLPYQQVLEGLESYNSSVLDKLSMEKYIEHLMREEAENGEDPNWQNVVPKQYEDQQYLTWKEITQDNLKPNTSYIFFVKPYSKDYDGSILETIIPTWMVITTLPDTEIPEGTPTVPNLGLHGKSDSEISVKWQYNSNFDYEIRYSRLDDPDTAAVWEFEISDNVEDPNYVPNGGNAVETIKGLFPDTNYNIWIRAKQKKGAKLSAWSNPVSTKTDILGKPVSPPGLGIASYQSILEAGRDFKAVGDNYLTVEWERIALDKDLDKSNQENQRVQKEYKYVVELADNPEFLDVKRVTVSKDNVDAAEDGYEILSRTMVSYDNLIANRPYYIRAKTVLIASDKENDRLIKKESDYTDVIRIITKPSQDEYDGEDTANEVIYPDKIKEDYKDDTWTYDVLDTQRVITEVVKGDQYKYVISMDKYRGRYNPRYRVIKLPQPLVKALINRGMELEIRTNILSIGIPAQALESYMLGTNTADILELKFSTLSSSEIYAIKQPDNKVLVSSPEKLEINLRGSSPKGPLTAVDKLLKIGFHMPVLSVSENMNLEGYTYNPYLANWQRGNPQVDKINGRLEYTSKSTGTYAVYQGYKIGEINAESFASVGTNEFINIILAKAENKANINPNKIPTAAEVSRARKSGLFAGNIDGTLTKEMAINGVVKLYELKQGVPVQPAYASGIEKARIIGLVDYVNPSARISYVELYDLIDQVTQ